MNEKTKFLERNEGCINPNVVDPMLEDKRVALGLIGTVVATDVPADVAAELEEAGLSAFQLDGLDTTASYVDGDTFIAVEVTTETKTPLASTNIVYDSEDNGTVTFVVDSQTDLDTNEITGETALNITVSSIKSSLELEDILYPMGAATIVGTDDTGSSVKFVLDGETDLTTESIGDTTLLVISKSELAAFLGITPDKLKEGVTICGVTGNEQAPSGGSDN